MTNDSQIAKGTPTITSLTGTLSAELKRVRVSAEISDASSIPDIEIFLLDERKEEITSSVIIGVVSTHLDFSLHLRNAKPSALFVMAAVKSRDGQLTAQKTVPVS